MLYIAESPGRGRGVFAQRQIHSGQLIERAPVIVVPAGQWEGMDRTVLFDYFFAWGEHSAIALGYGSLYNHAYQPNARFVKHFSQQVIEFYALRAIESDEEILINYNVDPGDDSPLWFHVLA
ncbi:MAG: SET domain-containing protein [Caldilineaceae bacterium]|nr:SET domain-containing protein [Caldilineaceae bacterium]